MSQPAHQTDLFEENLVVDTDIHLSLDMEAPAAYLDEPYRSHMLNPTGFPVPTSGWSRMLGEKIPKDEHYIEGPETIQEVLCERFGVDYPVLNATSWLPKIPSSDLAVALMRAFNDLVLDRYLDAYDHFRGLITLATQRPHLAAEEIDRLADERGIVGIYLATGGPEVPLGDPRYDPIYEAAQDNDLAVVYHGVADAFEYDYPKLNQGFEKFFEVHSLAHPWDQMKTVVSLISNGTPVKFPDLDFVFLEAGLSWVPHVMMRLNREYSMRRSEVPLLEGQPEEYIREFYFASQPMEEPMDPVHMQYVLEMVGPESIVFATDYPHWDFDHPTALGRHLETIFSPREIRAVLGENAAKVFGLPV